MGGIKFRLQHPVDLGEGEFIMQCIGNMLSSRMPFVNYGNHQ
jgi:hypothetical protein